MSDYIILTFTPWCPHGTWSLMQCFHRNDAPTNRLSLLLDLLIAVFFVFITSCFGRKRQFLTNLLSENLKRERVHLTFCAFCALTPSCHTLWFSVVGVATLECPSKRYFDLLSQADQPWHDHHLFHIHHPNQPWRWPIKAIAHLCVGSMMLGTISYRKSWFAGKLDFPKTFFSKEKVTETKTLTKFYTVNVVLRVSRGMSDFRHIYTWFQASWDFGIFGILDSKEFTGLSQALSNEASPSRLRVFCA